VAAEDALKRVTTTLSDLLRDRMATIEPVTFGPPSVDPGQQGGRINLFLYAASENASFRNDEDPRRAVSGQYGYPPLALELSYLITTYGAADATNGLPQASADELDAQRILGDAMRVLHDVPIVTRNTPAARALHGPVILDPGLQAEFESLRIVPHTMTLDDLSKLWTALQDDFQRSVAYDVSIMRIERAHAQAANAPVLVRRLDVRPSGTVGPIIVDLNPQSAAALQTVTIDGSGLIVGQTTILLGDAANTGFPKSPRAIAALPGTSVQFQVPNDPATYLPGPKLVTVRVNDPVIGHAFTSQAVILALLPGITNLSSNTGHFNGIDQVVIQGTLLGRPFDATLPSDPLVPTVLFGSYAIPPASIDYSQLPAQLTVTLPNVPASDPNQPPPSGSVLSIRVRVNGVESQSWRSNPVTGQLGPDPAFRFAVL
jgi:hypothetical protein